MFLLPLLLVPNVVLAASPLVDFDRMGLVGLSGAFAGLDFFSNTSFSLDPSSSSIVSRSSDGSLSYIASTNPGGRVLTSCTLNDIIYIAGSFSSIGSLQLANIASYIPSNNSFIPLSSNNSPNGPIDVIFCDAKEGKLWLGGNFTSPAHAVAVFDIKSGSWSSPPFTGLTGAQDRVNSITMNASGKSLFFAGSFITSFQGSPLSEGQNNPNVPYSPGATPFSSSLVPIPLQGAQILGSPSTTTPGFTNIQSILCPAGSDGPSNTWYGENGSPALITIRTFSSILASGVRLGNTFQPNHGTTEFSITTIPDNTVQTLSYVDPVSGQTQTCSTVCPLSTNPSFLYQDFLFQNPLTITGIQLKISAFTGVSPGLHILQILSSGAFASSVNNDNAQSCFATNPSNVTLVGSWQEQSVDTDIPGTTQPVLVTTLNVGTSSSSAPSITWMPYVSAAGNYNINLLVPGCDNMQDCGLRTSVKVTVFPGPGLQPSVNTISQTNRQDASILIYSGPVAASSPSFALTITMMLANNPQGAGQSGKYDIVANMVQLVLESVNGSTNSSGGNGTVGTQGTTRNGFGFFEWPLDSGSTDATTTLSNSSETALDSIGLDLFSGIGATSGFAHVTVTAVAYSAGVIYLGGEFSLSSGSASGSANIVAYRNGTLSGLPGNGLNGPVSSIVISGNLIFAGGSFTDTSSGSFQGTLRGVAVYNSESNQWQPLGGGVNGEVTDLALTGSQVLVAGRFTAAFFGNGDNAFETAGFAVWDLVNATWANSGGFLNSQLDMVTNTTLTAQLLAGNISALEKYGASGLVMIQNGNGGPSVTPFGIPLANGGINAPVPALVANNARRRWHAPTTSWRRTHSLQLSARQSSSSKQLVSLPQGPPAIAPAVLAGVFWANNSRELAIIGGNFSYVTPSSSVTSVGVYDPQSNTFRGLSGEQVNGTVRTLLVDSGRLYIGGEFGLSGSNVNGIAVYDLSKNEWTAAGLQPLHADSSGTVIVRSVTKPSSGNTIIVAGSFSSAGALSCVAICSFDASTLQWNMLGNGIQGEVASVSYAGANRELLIAAGSMQLPDGTITSVAQYSFTNGTWTSVGTSVDLPGPATAVEVNDGNANSIFAAGRSSDDSTSFLSFWNGSDWTILGSSLESNTTIMQLTMVPLQNTHTSNNVIESDRVLMVSGLLNDSTFGNASTALFDGRTLTPYIVTTSASGTVSFVASLFYSISNFSFAQHHFLATGVVILISIAIAAGVVFMLALIGILWTLFSRREDKFTKLDTAEDDDDSSLQHRPSSLLEHINAATRTTILGTSPYSNFNPEKEEEKLDRDGLDQEVYGADASNYVRAETPSDAIGGILAPEEASRPAHARYSFDGAEEGELPISAGAEVEILDDRDPSWWYARDVQTGREGVVPAAYLY